MSDAPSAAASASPNGAERPPSPGGPTVVGIGASAGGLAALQTFFSHIPERSGLAFVVVVHLNPEHESHLADLLQPHVRIPVQQVTETVPIEADHVYVIPPGREPRVRGHAPPALEARAEAAGPRPDRPLLPHPRRHARRALGGGDPHRHRLRRLAGGQGDQGEERADARAGPGRGRVRRDAAERHLHGAGGPRPPARRDPRGGAALRAHPAAGGARAGRRGARGREQRQLLQKIFAQVRTRTGRDFSRYKRSTILRRIQRRMQIRQVEELGAYVEHPAPGARRRCRRSRTTS